MTQTINEIRTAPESPLDGNVSGAGSALQNEFINSINENSAVGGFLASMDLAEANLAGDSKSAFQVNGVSESPLIVNENSKQYLEVPNPATDIYNTAAAQAAFDRRFDPQKISAVA